jgi:hypothetical protein
MRVIHSLLAVLLTSVLWDPVTLDCRGNAEPDQVRYRVYVFDNRCAFTAGGAPIYDVDGAGSSHPRCAAQGNHETTSTIWPVEEPRPNEAVGWDGFLEGQPPPVGAVDQAGNENRSDRPQCP